MTKGKRRVLIGIGAVFGLVAVAVTVFILTLDPNKAKKYISQGVNKATGRQLNINGDINVDWGWVSKISATDIQFENASWSKHPQMAEVGLVDVEIDLWQLLRHFRLVLPSVSISEPKVVLEKNAEGAANWDFRGSTAVKEPVVPENRTEFPVVQKLIIKRGALLFDDQVSKTQADLKVIEGEAAGFLDAPVSLKAEGSYQKLPMTISFNGGSYENLRSSSQPYPLEINFTVGKLKAKIDGNMTEPLEMKGEDITLDIEGDDMANLYPIIRLVFPKTPPYRLKGRLQHEGKVWSFSNFSGRVGDSDLSGNIRVDTAPKRPVMKADLSSNLLDFEDLAGFIGGTPEAGTPKQASKEQKKEAKKQDDAKKKDDRIFPDEKYDLQRLNSMDADVTLRAKNILAPKLPIDNLNAALHLKNGVLQFTPAAFGIGNGHLEIYSTFDGSQTPSKVKIDARMRNLDLKRFLAGSSFAEKTLGPVAGRITLDGKGQSFRELMATASGNTFVAVGRGEMSGLLIELAGLDVAQALGLVATGDKPVSVRCGLVELDAKDGRAAVNTMVFDTSDTVIYGEGNLDLRDEKVNLVLLPVPKDFSPLSLRSYIRVSGPLSDVSAFPDPIKTGTDSWIKKIFNALTVLLLTPFQPRDLAQGKNIDCAALLANAHKYDPNGALLKDVYATGKPPAANEEPQQRQANRAKRQENAPKSRGEPAKSEPEQRSTD
jgi:AsmA family protein